jgi:glycosyltransferase involved in cell wall biosynthesis
MPGFTARQVQPEACGLGGPPEAHSGAPALRVCLLTDTLGDINGVSRFIRTIAGVARQTGRDLRIITSTRLPVPREPNIHNYPPIVSRPMPGYANLELVLPPARAMLAAIRRFRPHAVHISTPGPVGMVGLLGAKLTGARVLGVYHTDFPAYIERLFDDPSYSWLSRLSMRGFYAPFTTIFTRSDEYAHAVRSLGVPEQRLVRLRPGIDVRAFDRRFREEHAGAQGIWRTLGLTDGAARALKVLYAGRISIEKDLPLLVRAWPRVRELVKAAAPALPPPQLLVLGDGPYLGEMRAALAGMDAHFLGFRHGEELATIYASCDLFAFPSTTDTLGQVVMEAQASGLPVLVSDQGGPQEVVRNGVTGRVLPSGRHDVWASAMAELLLDSPRRIAMGSVAHEVMRSMRIEDSFEHFWSLHDAACPPADRVGT